VNSVGEASHINGAKPGAARYNPSLTLEELKSADNALWLCRTCADKIDNDEARYPESLLRTWKALAEARAEGSLGKPWEATGQAGPAQPALDVRFVNDKTAVDLAASWEYAPPRENKKVERIPPRGQGRGVTVIYPFCMWYTPGKVPGTTPLAFRIENQSVIEAKNVEVTIRLPEGCRPVTVDMMEYAYRSEKSKALTKANGQITVRVESLFHRPMYETAPVHVAFPTPETTYDIHWTATAGNMLGERSGVLQVHLLGREVPPTGQFPR